MYFKSEIWSRPYPCCLKGKNNPFLEFTLQESWASLSSALLQLLWRLVVFLARWLCDCIRSMQLLLLKHGPVNKWEEGKRNEIGFQFVNLDGYFPNILYPYSSLSFSLSSSSCSFYICMYIINSSFCVAWLLHLFLFLSTPPRQRTLPWLLSLHC